MMTKALYRKWRPQDWNEVAAQDHVIQTIRNAVVNDRVAHAYLFAGPRGTGKTTTARLLAKAVNCLAPDLEKRPCNECEHCLALNAGRFLDLIEIDAASNTSVDDVRDLRDKINFSPSQGRYKVYIIDEVHMLSTAAFNALLKTLEEPPPHAIFILATTEVHKIPATVLSRCQHHEFRRIPLKIIVDYLKEKSSDENLHVEEAVFIEIARQATGSLRDAISLLDQLTSTNEVVNLEMAQNILGTATDLRVLEIIDALIAKDTSKGLIHINEALDSGADPRQLARQIVTYLRQILLIKTGNRDQVEMGEDFLTRAMQHAVPLSMPDILTAIEAFNRATSNEKANWHPGLGLELAFTGLITSSQPPDSHQDIPSERPIITQQVKKSTKGKPPSKKPTKVPESKAEPVNQPPPQDEPKPTESLPTIPESIGDTEKKQDLIITIQEIQQEWNRIKTMVGSHNRRTEGLLNTSKIAGIKDNALILGFSSETLKEMMEKEGNINLTCDILEEIFNYPIGIKCIVTSQQGSPIPDNIKIDQDGMVSTATRDLGGRISRAEEADQD